MYKLLIKLFLLITIFVCCVLIGVLFSKFFKRKRDFYLDLVSFCDSAKLNISYSRLKLSEIIDNNFQNYSNDFKNFLNEYQRNIICDKEKLKDLINFLDKSSSDEIVDFFCSIGKMTKDEEIENFEINNKRFIQKKDMAIENYNKYSSLFIKLFVVCGLMLVIIFV